MKHRTASPGARGRRLALAIVLAAAAACPVAAQAPPGSPGIAVVTDLRGAAWLQRRQGRDTLAPLDVLRAGDTVAIADGGEVEIAFTAGAGRVLTLAGPGRFEMAVDTVRVRGRGRVQARDLAAAWRALLVQPGAVGRASIALRSLRATDVPLRAPRGTLDGAAPALLQWDPPYGRAGGPWRYEVRIIDASGSQVFAARTAANALAPEPSIAWERGAEYLWRVDAVGADGRRAAGVAAFRLLDPMLAVRLASVREEVAQARGPARRALARAEEVLLALAYEDAGLTAAACGQWAQVAQVRPEFAALTTCER